MKGTVEDLKKSTQTEQDSASTAGTTIKAETANGETSAGTTNQGTPSEDHFESASAGTEEGPSGAQGQEQGGGAAEGQTAGAASSSASLMSRFRNAAEVVRREVRISSCTGHRYLLLWEHVLRAGSLRHKNVCTSQLASNGCQHTPP